MLIWKFWFLLTSGDIPKNNSRKCQFFTKMTKNKKLPNFLSNFQNWFRNDLQHLTEVFRPYHPCKKSLEIDFQIPKKKVFLIFPFFSRFLGVYFYKASWLVNTCWLNVDQFFVFMSEIRSSLLISKIMSISQKLIDLERKTYPSPQKRAFFLGGGLISSDRYFRVCLHMKSETQTSFIKTR